MSQSAKTVLTVVAVIVGLWIAYGIVTTLVGMLLKILVPLVILGGIGYAVYALVWKNNALSGGRRYLP